MQTAERVQRVLAKVAAVDPTVVKPESSLQHFLDSAASSQKQAADNDALRQWRGASSHW